MYNTLFRTQPSSIKTIKRIIGILNFTVGNTATVYGEVHPPLLPLVYFGFSTVFLASLFGNSVIIHIIRTNNSMRTTINYLIINQACADLLISFAEISGIFYYSYSGSAWIGGILGLISCKMFVAILFISPNFSVLILVSIAFDRFYAVTRPLRLSPISKHLKKIIFSCWAWSIASSLDYLVKKSFKNVKGSYLCDVTTPFDKWNTFNTISITLNVFLPLSMITVLYTFVCRRLRSREVPGEGNNQNEEQAAALKTARKVTRMMIIVVVLYVICWLPMYMSVLLRFVNRVQVTDGLFFFSNFLALCYSGINPYIYLTFSQNFRKGLRKLFRKLCRKLRLSNVVNFFRSQSVELEQI